MADIKKGSKVRLLHIEGNPEGKTIDHPIGGNVDDIIAFGQDVLVEIKGAPFPVLVATENLEVIK